MLSQCQTSHALFQLFVIFTMKLQLKQNFHIATVLLYYIWLSVTINKSCIILPRSVTVYLSQVNGSHITCACINLCLCHVVIACKKLRRCGCGASIGGIMFIPSFLKNNELFEKLKCVLKHAHARALSLSLSLSFLYTHINTHTYIKERELKINPWETRLHLA